MLIEVRDSSHAGEARRQADIFAEELGLGESERGAMHMETLNGPRVGLRLTFEDNGPGIPNIELALRDGFTTGSGLGLGLGGAKRLVNEFSVDSRVGQGTKVTITRWK